MSDPIHNPNHYTSRGGIEPLDFIMSNNLGFCEGNIIKYVFRYQQKNGVEDLKKARVYLDRLIDKCEQEDAQDHKEPYPGFGIGGLAGKSPIKTKDWEITVI